MPNIEGIPIDGLHRGRIYHITWCRYETTDYGATIQKGGFFQSRFLKLVSPRRSRNGNWYAVFQHRNEQKLRITHIVQPRHIVSIEEVQIEEEA